MLVWDAAQYLWLWATSVFSRDSAYYKQGTCIQHITMHDKEMSTKIIKSKEKFGAV